MSQQEDVNHTFSVHGVLLFMSRHYVDLLFSIVTNRITRDKRGGFQEGPTVLE